MAASFDFMAAQMKHKSWVARMRGFLDGQESLTVDQAVSHRDCDLGKWLYSAGLEKYGDQTEMQQLERIHTNLHATVKKIITLKDSGDIAGAEAAQKDLERTSEEIIGLLKTLDAKLN